MCNCVDGVLSKLLSTHPLPRAIRETRQGAWRWCCSWKKDDSILMYMIKVIDTLPKGHCWNTPPLILCTKQAIALIPLLQAFLYRDFRRPLCRADLAWRHFGGETQRAQLQCIESGQWAHADGRRTRVCVIQFFTHGESLCGKKGIFAWQLSWRNDVQ